MNRWTAGLAFSILMPSLLWAFPKEINYQGAIKEGPYPVNGKRTIRVRITDANGADFKTPSGNWPGVSQEVMIQNGLFSLSIPAPALDWPNIDPYLEIAIDGQVLSPREKLKATPYSFVSEDVVDHAITKQKLSPQLQNDLVPQGAIMMFAKACPSGWSKLSEMNGKFPMGGDNYGVTGGSATHSHTLTMAEHTHTVSDNSLKVAIGMRNIGYDNNLVMQPSKTVGRFSILTADSWYGYGSGMGHPAPVLTNSAEVDVAGPKVFGNTEGATYSGASIANAESNVPPYMTVIFCLKQ